MKHFRSEVIEELGHYVYVSVDPRLNEAFYVEKGVRNRVFQHLDEASEFEKVK